MTEHEAFMILGEHIKGIMQRINHLNDLANKTCGAQVRIIEVLAKLTDRIEALEFKKSFGDEK